MVSSPLEWTFQESDVIVFGRGDQRRSSCVRETKGSPFVTVEAAGLAVWGLCGPALITVTAPFCLWSRVRPEELSVLNGGTGDQLQLRSLPTLVKLPVAEGSVIRRLGTICAFASQGFVSLLTPPPPSGSSWGWLANQTSIAIQDL